MMWSTLLFPFYRCANQGLELLRNLPKVIELHSRLLWRWSPSTCPYITLPLMWGPQTVARGPVGLAMCFCTACELRIVFNIFICLGGKIKRIMCCDTWKLYENQISVSVNKFYWNTASYFLVYLLPVAAFTPWRQSYVVGTGTMSSMKPIKYFFSALYRNLDSFFPHSLPCLLSFVSFPVAFLRR